MSGTDRQPIDLEDCVEDLRRYLADDIPPLLVADAVRALVLHAPEAVTGQMQSWLSFQHQARQGTVTAADLAFHALRKLHVLGELALVPRDELGQYLPALVEALASLCPPEDRELVRSTLERLRQAPAADSSFRVGDAMTADRVGEAGRPHPPVSPETSRELRQFALLLDRLKAHSGAAPGVPAAPAEELVASLFAAAASSAADASELGKYLEHLRELGVEATGPQAVVRVLGRALPAWAPPAAPAPDELAGTARALHRFVDLADGSQQRVERFRELVAAIVEAFNSGSLARAVSLVQVAGALVGEGNVPVDGADLATGRAHESLDGERLRALAVDPHQQPLLCQLMEFLPGLRPEALLTDLDDESDRARRRLLLTLVEVHGQSARPVLLERLEASLADSRDTAWFLRRNLVYLLHRLPCPAEALEERELDLVVELSELRHHPRLIGEAVIRLGQIEDARAELALQTRLEEVERAIAAPDAAAPQVEDLERLRALLVTNLLRRDSATARRAVVAAAVRRLRETADASRVAGLAATDLSAETDLLGELLRQLEQRLPRKVLGVTLHRNTEAITAIVEGLAGTRAPAVRRTLAEIAERFPREPFGVAAARALQAKEERRPAAAEPETSAPGASPQPGPPRMEGDLQIFGLPNLLQSLAQSQLTGTLTLRDEKATPVAELELREGDLAACSAGRLEGDSAFYQLLVRPTASSFLFVGRESTGAGPGATEAREVLGLLMEGMRRFDEYQRARALVPDNAVLVPSGTRPTSLPGEADGAFVRELWGKVKAGATATGCENSLPADAYRVRALLAHWLAEGAVTVEPSLPEPA
ncbi:MAG TPA: DUF4388 domain-containing protein [Thermoanaerobaculia bacterium]|nr:DUF4388 domain-containing protein [Thermoanaerobaculia bacterium]